MMENPDPPKAPVPLHEDRLFQLLVMVSSALGMGGVVSSLTLLDGGPNGFEFHWNNLALPGFAIGCLFSCAYWWIVFRMKSGSGRSGSRFLMASSGLVIVFAIVAFLYPVRFIPREKRMDVAIGLFAALLVLGTIGYLIHTLVRWLEQEVAEGPSDGSSGEE